MSSRLSAFLHPTAVQEEKEVIISKRFLGEDGEPVPFRIRSLTQEENDELIKKSTRVTTKNGQRQEALDSLAYNRRIIVAATVEPDMASKELCDAYGVMDPLLVPGKMLLSGEYGKLLREILTLSGFHTDENVEETAKN